MNLPNSLTLLRLLLVPGFLVAVIYGALGLALGIFVAAALTDLLDGFFARKLGQKTELGACLDPLADKTLVTVAYVSLAVTGVLPAWLAVVVVSRDFFIVLGAGVLFLLAGRNSFPPEFLGKTTTGLQLVNLGLYLLCSALGLQAGALSWLAALTAVVTVVSGCQYVVAGLRNLPSESPAAQRTSADRNNQ